MAVMKLCENHEMDNAQELEKLKDEKVRATFFILNVVQAITSTSTLTTLFAAERRPLSVGLRIRRTAAGGGGARAGGGESGLAGAGARGGPRGEPGPSEGARGGPGRPPRPPGQHGEQPAEARGMSRGRAPPGAGREHHATT
eukprot:5094812-Pyramimonas_sp.AAC.2